MCEQSEVVYLDGEVVWVKLGSCWWPGQVIAPEKLPPDVMPSFRKPPIAVVKFFQEDTYEYVKNITAIYKYNCSRKSEFINKGLYMYRTKHGHMEKFPEDVIRAETATGGDIEILTRDEFQETKKESYAGLFGDSTKKTPASVKKGRGRGRSSEFRKISPPIRKISKEKMDYKVHILVQTSQKSKHSTENPSTPSTSRNEEPSEDLPKVENPNSISSTPTVASPGMYSCHACPFTTSRLNVMILHNKTHSVTFTPYTPSPVKKKSPVKLTLKSTPKLKKPKLARTPKERSSKIFKKSQGTKRPAPEKSSNEVKKQKTDVEIKSSLLADWDDGDEESNDEPSTVVSSASPELPVPAESPAAPEVSETSSSIFPSDSTADKKCENSTSSEKPESTNDCKYEFCEDEDWPLEADGDRKIPRVKNLTSRKDGTKSLSLDEDEVAKEVAELLSKTSLPELPSVPEPLKVEENFPEPSVVKSPDKTPENSSESNKPPEHLKIDTHPSKAIFKTKTFFRSRHSRSQDAIGKYVAEQLNAAERMDATESEINGSEVASSPEARESPPMEPMKVARLAPKIQLKKMKAEAAQLRGKDKNNFEKLIEDSSSIQSRSFLPESTITESEDIVQNTDRNVIQIPTESSHSVLYPTQEIKPINKEVIETKLTADGDKNIRSGMSNPLSGINTQTISNPKESTVELIKKSDETVQETEKNVEHISDSTVKYPETNIHETYQKTVEPYMSETTASAVDALLSVSREADRVTKIISNDLPEDLFEDDNKDTGTVHSSNGLDEFKENVEKIGIQKADVNGDEDTEKNDANIISNFSDNITDNIDSNFTDNISITKKDEAIVTSDNIVKDNTEIQELKENITLALTPEPDGDIRQIAETLINLPSTVKQGNTSNEHRENLTALLSENSQYGVDNQSRNNTVNNSKLGEDIGKSESKTDQNKLDFSPETISITNNESLNVRFETEQEKSENLNAAQSLVQMSESIDHKINIVENSTENTNDIKSSDALNITNKSNSIESVKSIERNVSLLSNENNSDPANGKVENFQTPSKLLRMLEEPCQPKSQVHKPIIAPLQILSPGKEKILNLDVAKSPIKAKTSPKQKIIIRRTTPSRPILNSLKEVPAEKIILSRSNKPVQDGSSIQTYTIQASPEIPTDAKSIIIQPKIRKITKTAVPKQQKMKAQPLLKTVNETKTVDHMTDDAIFDINSMPVVLSDELLTPESIEKMPIVMSDGNIVSSPPQAHKFVKSKPILPEKEKIAVSSGPYKPDSKKVIMSPASPNILSKSSKIRSAKPMLVIDKTTGKQKIIMTKSEPNVKEVKQTIPKVQQVPQSSSKSEKFIILPSNAPRPARAQKIVIDPQTGKAHVLVSKAPDVPITAAENKPVSAKLIAPSDNSNPGNTVMIITNAQGGQSRIVLTPEHEKILFPNKQQQNVTQLKTITQRVTTNPVITQKTVVSTVAPAKTQTRIVPKQKSAIITSKGQLIVGGRVATTAQNIAPMPEIRPATKRVVTSEPKKIVQAIQKTQSEPLILLQQKSGAVMQLTTAQFEHLQRTGQIIAKTPAPPQENKMIVQKTITIPSNESILAPIQKQRAKRPAAVSPSTVKRAKQEVAIAPAPAPITRMPTLTPLSNTNVTSIVPSVSNTVSITTTYPELENFEELLPSTAIARQVEQPVVVQPEQPVVPPLTPTPAPAPAPALLPAPAPPVCAPAPEPAPLTDGQLLAVPGEHFGGPPGSFYLCMEDNGTLTPIDNGPLVLENNQLVPMMVEPMPVLTQQPERRDILEAALANSDVFHADVPRDDAPDFRDLNANVSVHCRVSETSTTLNQPIMTPVEVPSKVDSEPTTVPSNLEDGLAVIGVTPHTIPTSLELPITVTDPRIAPKTTDPLSNNNYGAALLPSPNTEMTFMTTEEVEVPSVGPISMPLLTGEETVGKSMPILTDDVNERTVSSVESTVGSPSSLEVRESEAEDGVSWSRRLLTPSSDTSETSAEIPLQPGIQLSVSELSRNS